MGLKSQRVSSKKSIASLLKSWSSSATAYQDAKMRDDYFTGQITGSEYLNYLRGKADKTNPKTTAFVSLTKAIRSVEKDLEQNSLQTKIDLGTEDPIKMADLLSQRVVDDGIIEGTPEYNQILKAVVNLRDQSVNYEKRKKAQEYRDMKLIDPSQADKMWDDYLQTLPSRMSNQLAVESAQNESTNFHNTRIKSEIARAIKATSDELKQAGIEGSSFHAAMRDAYSEASVIAKDNGLIDYANTLDNYAFTSNQNYANAASSEIKSSGARERELAKARTWDIEKQIQLASKSGDIELLSKLNQELENNVNLEIELNNQAKNYDTAAMLGKKLVDISGEKQKLNDSFVVSQDGTIASKPLLSPDGTQVIGPDGIPQFLQPEVGDYIMVVNERGDVEKKSLTRVNEDKTFEADGWKPDGKNLVVDPRTGYLLKVNASTIEQGNDTDGKPVKKDVLLAKDANGNTINVGKTKEGDNILLGEEIMDGDKGTGVFKMPKADGGFDFVSYDGATANPITSLEASKFANKPIKDVLNGSTNKDDQEIVNRMGTKIYNDEIGKNLGLQEVLKGLDQKNEANKRVAALLREAEARQQEQAKASTVAPSPLLAISSKDQAGIPVPQIAPPPVSKGVGEYISPTELIAPAPTISGPKNAGVLGSQQTIAKGYYRRPKPDGGFDFVKEGFGNISVEDLSRETKIDKARLLDPKATKFGLF